MEFILRPIGFFLLILLGAQLSRIGFFKPVYQEAIVTIVLNLTVPCAAVYAFGNTSTGGPLLSVAIIGFLCALIPLPIFFFLTRRMSDRQRSFYLISATGSSLGCFMLPLLQGFWGATGAVLVCAFDVGNAILTTGGSRAITSLLLGEKDGKRSVGEVAKRFLRSVAIDTYLVLLVLMTLDLPIPPMVVALVEPAADANAFLSMLMIGMMLRSPRKAWWGDILRLLLGRLILAAVFSVAILCWTPFSGETQQILALIPFAPIGVLAPFFIGDYGGNCEMASFANTMSALLSLVVVTTLYFLVIQRPIG